MKHEDATRYFDDLGARVPDRRPPMADIVRSGELAARRKSRMTSASLAASAALVLGGVVAVQQATTGDGDGPVDLRPAEVGPTTTTAPDDAPAGPLGVPHVRNGRCPGLAVPRNRLDPTVVPAPGSARGLAVNESGTVAAWFEPEPGPLPFLVVYDVAEGKELAREDLGVTEDRRSASLRVGEQALYYRSSADAQVWMRYRWGVDDFPQVHAVCDP